MNPPDLLTNVLGVLYGLLLMSTVFVRTKLTEAMRIDALFIRDYSDRTRPVNLLVGSLVAGYALYSLLARL